MHTDSMAPRSIPRSIPRSRMLWRLAVPGLLLPATLAMLAMRLPQMSAPAVLAAPVAAPVKAAPVIKISPVLPADIPGGAQQADLTAASVFAWQEFIALNWPAAPQTGQRGQRGTANPKVRFGNPGYAASGGPLVWETLRSKVEIFPGGGSYPPGYNPQQAKKGYYGFDALPVYTYLQPVPPCPGETAAATPWINLDEVDQIGLDIMFAGVLPAAATPTNSVPQQIRFLAKGNRAQYDYIAANSYWNHGGDFFAAVENFTNSIALDKVPPPASIVTFPAGTVEMKAAWRMLAPEEDRSRFHTTTVRYYESAGAGGAACYRQATWGLIALHIIQKTPSAPSFIFATFEQADNLRLPDGTPVENDDGTIVAPPPAGTPPTSPYPTYQDGCENGIQDPKVSIGTQAFCTDPGKRLFYRNSQAGLPQGSSAQDSICVNTRYNSIPPAVVRVNQIAHAAIAAYQKGTPWEHYKLVNVQSTPFEQGQGDPATFSQANIVVETDSTLQAFKGVLLANGPDAGVDTSFAPGCKPAHNVYVPSGKSYQAHNMGGCMGCHGNAQVAGTDFSFILKAGPVLSPEFPTPSPDPGKLLRYISSPAK
jgi:hypothetical protein